MSAPTPPIQTGEIFSRKPGIAHKLHHMTDVAATRPTDGQALVWNAVLGTWEPQTVTTDTSAIEADIIALQAELDAHEANVSNPHSTTHAQVGSPTITDTTAPSVDTNTIQILLSNLANRLKAISGESGWKSTPATTLAALVTSVAAHIANVSNPHSVTHSQIGTIVAADLGAGAATDTVLGNRTVTDTTAPAADDNTLTILLSNLANRIKALSGESGWKDAPDTTLAAAATHAANTSNPHAVTFSQVATYQHADASGGLTLDNSITDIPGATLTLAAAGTYLVFSNVRVNYDATSVAVFVYLNVNGTNGTNELYQHDSDGTGLVTFIREVTTGGASQVIKLRASESTLASSTIIQAGTSLTSIRVA
jgi:hypothetical protein